MVRERRQAAILFLHIGWARQYRGEKGDVPIGKFGFIKSKTGIAGETVNFKDMEGYCYGYAPHGSIDPTRLGGSPGDEYVDDVLVIFTATSPDGSGRYIVGWYKDARVYSERQQTRPDRQRPDFLVQTAAGDAYVVPIDDRTFYVPAREPGWPGIANAFYAGERLTGAERRKLLDYVGGKRSAGFVTDEPTASKPSRRTRRPDPAANLEVEIEAERLATVFYQSRGYEVRRVAAENSGWDLEATLGRRKLLIEVKGRSSIGAVELTPNEYAKMIARDTRMQYRLAVAHETLGHSARLNIFQYVPGSKTWETEEGLILQIAELTGARMSFG